MKILNRDQTSKIFYTVSPLLIYLSLLLTKNVYITLEF